MKSLPPILWLLFAFAASLFAAGCEEPKGPSDVAVIPEGAPEDESWNAAITLSDSVGLRARIRVGHVRRYVSRSETLLDSGLFVEFFGPSGAITATLVADSARIDDRTQDMSAFGRVHVVSEAQQTTVDTDRLHWDSARRRLHSDAWVRIDNRARGERIEGRGFESDESLQRTKIFNVSGEINAPG